MKTVPAKELQTNLGAVLNSSQKERIVVSRRSRDRREARDTV